MACRTCFPCIARVSRSKSTSECWREKGRKKKWLLYRHLLGIDRLWNKCIFVLEVQHHFPKNFKRDRSFWSPLMEKSCPGKRVTLPSELTLGSVRLLGVFMRKNWPLFPSQQCSRMFSLSSLDRVDPASLASWSGEMLARLEGWAHHTGSLADRLEPRPLLWKGVYQLILSGNFRSCRQQF